MPAQLWDAPEARWDDASLWDGPGVSIVTPPIINFTVDIDHIRDFTASVVHLMSFTIDIDHVIDFEVNTP